MKMTLTKALLCATLTPLLLTTHALGAVISWQTPVNVDLNDSTQVLNNGTLFTIFTINSTPTLNGVNFASNPHPFAYSAGIGGGTTLTPSPATPYSTILGSDAFYTPDTASASGANMLVFGGTGGNALTIGQTYELQLWAGYFYPPYGVIYDRYSASAPSINGGGFTDGKYHATGESANVVVANSGSATSQFVVGTFVADAATQDLYFYGEDTYGNLNALQLRAIAPVPEPTTVTLLSIGVLGLVVRRRFRQRKLIAGKSFV